MSEHEWVIYALGIVTGCELATIVMLTRWSMGLLARLDRTETSDKPGFIRGLW